MIIMRFYQKKFTLGLLVFAHGFTLSMEPALARSEDPLEKAAKAGDPQAQYELGEKFYRGHGIDYLDQAERWFRNAALQEHPAALHKLAVIEETRKHRPQAIEYYLRAAELGNIFSHFELARLFGPRAGADKSLNREILHLKGVLTYMVAMRAADNELPRVVAKTKASAACRLGEIYESASPETEVSIQLAKEYYRLAFEFDAHCDKAYYKLAALLLRVNPENRVQAKQLLLKTTEAYAPAQCLLGTLARDEGKYEEAMGYFSRVTTAGDALYELGVFYERGQGTKQDGSKAWALFRQAAEQGHRGAIA